MSWMTEAGAVPPWPAGACSTDMSHLLHREQLGHPVVALVQPVQRQVQLRGRAEDQVVRLLAVHRHEQQVPVTAYGQAESGQMRGECPRALGDLDGEHVA